MKSISNNQFSILVDGFRVLGAPGPYQVESLTTENFFLCDLLPLKLNPRK